MYHFQQFQWIWRDLTIILKILKNMHFRNHKIQLSRAVWSVSLLRPHSGRHTETAIIDNYFVFQDLRFPYVSLFLKFIAKSFNILGFGQILSNRPGGAMKNDIYRYAGVRTSSKLRKLAAVKMWESTDHYPWSHLQINNPLRIARNKISYQCFIFFKNNSVITWNGHKYCAN